MFDMSLAKNMGRVVREVMVVTPPSFTGIVTRKLRFLMAFTAMVGLVMLPILIALPSLAADDEVLVAKTDEDVLMAKKGKDEHAQKECKKGDKDCMTTCAEKDTGGEWLCPKVKAPCGFTCGAFEAKAGCNSNPSLHCRTVASGSNCDCQCVP
jgi:hypothetical protein